MKVHAKVLYLSCWFLAACGTADYPVATIELVCDDQGSLCVEVALIEGGSFFMGNALGEVNEQPVHIVTVPSFKIMTTEVTQKMYEPCIEEGVCPANEGYFEAEDLPVGNISWDDAQIYISWLNKRQSKQYRLPTEAEWEYSARAGTLTNYSWGDEFDCRKANTFLSVHDSACDYPAGPKPVKSYSKNSFGLYDMSGNVWEWVQDCRFINDHYELSPIDGSARAPVDSACPLRGYRGGSFNDDFSLATSSFRASHTSDFRSLPVGFRLAHDL